MGEESMGVGKKGGGFRGRETRAGRSEISGYKDLVNDACVSVHRNWSRGFIEDGYRAVSRRMRKCD